jgi:hypothetical protein
MLEQVDEKREVQLKILAEIAAYSTFSLPKDALVKI